MEIKPCRSYHAILSGFRLVTMPDGRSRFKIYYLSIIGRSQPERYEWEKCSLSHHDFAGSFINGGFEGIGLVTAFPHITKVFRFGPAMETLMEVAAYRTADMSKQALARGDDYYEFACYAEAVLAAAEFQAWAQANSVDEYLRFRADSQLFKVVRHDKLQRYWQTPGM